MHFAYLFTLLSTVAGPIVKKVLSALGIGAVSYVGINLVLDQAKSAILSNMSGLPSDIAMLLGLVKVDVCINIILSAVATRALLAGVSKSSGSKKSLGSVGDK